MNLTDQLLGLAAAAVSGGGIGAVSSWLAALDQHRTHQ